MDGTTEKTGWLPEPTYEEHRALLEMFPEVKDVIRAAGADAVAEEAGGRLTVRDVRRAASAPLSTAAVIVDEAWRAAERIMLARHNDPDHEFALTLEVKAVTIEPSAQEGPAAEETENDMTEITMHVLENDKGEIPAGFAAPAVEAPAVEAPAVEAPAPTAPTAGKKYTKRDGAERAAQLTTARGAKARVYSRTAAEWTTALAENGNDLDTTVKAILTAGGITVP